MLLSTATIVAPPDLFLFLLLFFDDLINDFEGSSTLRILRDFHSFFLLDAERIFFLAFPVAVASPYKTFNDYACIANFDKLAF